MGVGFACRHRIEVSIIDEMKTGSGPCAGVGHFLRGCVQLIPEVAQGLFRAGNHGAGAKMAGDAMCCRSMVMHVEAHRARKHGALAFSGFLGGMEWEIPQGRFQRQERRGDSLPRPRVFLIREPCWPLFCVGWIYEAGAASCVCDWRIWIPIAVGPSMRMRCVGISPGWVSIGIQKSFSPSARRGTKRHSIALPTRGDSIRVPAVARRCVPLMRSLQTGAPDTPVRVGTGPCRRWPRVAGEA